MESSAGEGTQRSEGGAGWEVFEYGLGSATPSARICVATAVVGRSVYAFGGAQTAPGSSSKIVRYFDSFHRFDAGERRWEAVEIAVPAAGGSAALGGSNGLAEEPPLPSPRPCARHSATLVHYNDMLVLFGGCAEGQVALGDCWVFDLNFHSWTRLRPADGDAGGPGPRGIGPLRAKRVNGRVGSPQTGAAPAAGGGSGPKARYGHSAVVSRGGMYIFGGWSSDFSAQANTVWCLDLERLVWAELDSAPGPAAVAAARGATAAAQEKRYGHVATVFDDVMYVFGGSHSTRVSSDISAFDLNTCRWTCLPEDPERPGPGPRRGHAAALLGSTWLIHGGVQAGGEQPVAFEFDFLKKAWAPVALFGGASGGSGVSGGGRLLSQHSLLAVENDFSTTVFTFFGAEAGAGAGAGAGARASVGSAAAAPQPHPATFSAVDFIADRALTDIADDAAAIDAATAGVLAVIPRVMPRPPDPAHAALEPVKRALAETLLPQIAKSLAKVEAKVESRVDLDRYAGVRNAPVLRELVAALRHFDRLRAEVAAVAARAAGAADGDAALDADSVAEQLPAWLAQLWNEDAAAVNDILASGPALEVRANALGKSVEPVLRYVQACVSDAVAPALDQLSMISGSDAVANDMKFAENAADAARRILQTEERAATLTARSKKSLDERRVACGLQFLEALAARADCVAETMQQPSLLGPAEAELAQLTEEVGRSLDGELEGAAKMQGTFERLLASLKKAGSDQEAAFVERVAQTEQKRAACQKRRRELLAEVAAFLEKASSEYGSILEEERAAALEAETYARATAESWRRVRDLETTVSGPLSAEKDHEAAVSTVLRPCAAAVAEAARATLQSLSREGSSRLAAQVQATVSDLELFPALHADLLRQLEQALRQTERNARLLQNRIRAAAEDLAAAEELRDASVDDIRGRLSQLEGAEEEAQTELRQVTESVDRLAELKAAFDAALKRAAETKRSAPDGGVGAELDDALFDVRFEQPAAEPVADAAADGAGGYSPDLLARLRQLLKAPPPGAASFTASPPKTARGRPERGQIISQTTTISGRVRTTTTVRKEQQLMPDGRVVTRTTTRRSRQTVA